MLTPHVSFKLTIADKAEGASNVKPRNEAMHHEQVLLQLAVTSGGLQAAAVAVEASGTTGPLEVERAAKMSPAATGPHLLLPFPGLMQETLVERVRNVHMVRDLGVTTATDTVHHGAAMTATAGTGGTSMPRINHKEPKAPAPTRAVLAEDTLPMLEGATEVVPVPEADETICITACGSTVLAAIKSDSPCPALVSAGDPEERLVLAIEGSMEWVYGLGACARKRVHFYSKLDQR